MLARHQYGSKILIKKAYLKKALVTHPDRGGSQLEFQQVSIAYTLLLKKLKDKENFYKVNKSFYENYHKKNEKMGIVIPILFMRKHVLHEVLYLNRLLQKA